jgi:hypothetical protein
MDAILLQENQVSALPDLDKTFISGIREPVEDRLQADLNTAVPLSDHN